MPTKIETETQLLRLLSNSPLQLEIDLLQVKSHISKNVSREHMLKFYKTYDDVKDEKFDGMIVTGAPVEMMDFEEVDYWDELCKIFDWAKTNVYSTFNICWGAQAALYYNYGIPKHLLPEKVFGVFRHQPLDLYHPLLRGFSDVFYVPHSRHTEVRRADIEKVPELTIMAESYSRCGVYAIANVKERQFFITGHAEYDPLTLKWEYERDVEAGLNIQVPCNYYPNDDPSKQPIVKWRSVANLLFANWLNYYVYQETPYDLSQLKPMPRYWRNGIREIK